MKPAHAPQQVGTEYGVSVQDLAEWRRKKIGPPYYVLGTHVICYMPENVINGSAIRPTHAGMTYGLSNGDQLPGEGDYFE